MLNTLDFTDPEYLMSRYLEMCERIAALELAVKNLTEFNTGSPKLPAEIVCGNVPCFYCVNQCDFKNIGFCGDDYPDFTGRQLRAGT